MVWHMEAGQRKGEVEEKMDETLALSESWGQRQTHPSQTTERQPDTSGLISYTQAFNTTFGVWVFGFASHKISNFTAPKKVLQHHTSIIITKHVMQPDTLTECDKTSCSAQTTRSTKRCKTWKEWQQKGRETQEKKEGNMKRRCLQQRKGKVTHSHLKTLYRYFPRKSENRQTGGKKLMSRNRLKLLLSLFTSVRLREIWFLTPKIRECARKKKKKKRKAVAVPGWEQPDWCLYYSNHNCISSSTNMHSLPIQIWRKQLQDDGFSCFPQVIINTISILLTTFSTPKMIYYLCLSVAEKNFLQQWKPVENICIIL